MFSPNLGWRAEDNFSLHKIFWIKAKLSILLNCISALPHRAPIHLLSSPARGERMFSREPKPGHKMGPKLQLPWSKATPGKAVTHQCNWKHMSEHTLVQRDKIQQFGLGGKDISFQYHIPLQGFFSGIQQSWINFSGKPCTNFYGEWGTCYKCSVSLSR